jgi:RNA polymerase sigma factor (sigma-70 family)
LSAIEVQSAGQDDRDRFVVATLREHAASMLALARRHSLCADDAEDAYQRAVEIFLRRADTVRRETVGPWIRTVVKHEAMALRAQRQASVESEDVDLDAQAGDHPSEDERVVRFDRLTRAAEALQRLKPQEARALVLLAQGHSYREICAITGWTYTKVNRCVTEGRRALLDRYADIEVGEECARWAPVLEAVADGEASARQLLAVRPHLRRCPGCRATVRAYHEVPRQVAGLIPLGAMAPLAAGAQARIGGLPGLVARVHEALAAGVHDRIALSVQKAQGLIEATSTGKVAAMAASTVALAGGGYVAGEGLIDPPHRPPVVRAATHTSHRGHRSAAVAGSGVYVPVALTTPTPATAAPGSTSSSPTAASSHASAATKRHERARQSARAASTEFSADGAADPGAGTAPLASGASGTGTSRSTPAKAPPVARATPPSGSEFGG